MPFGTATAHVTEMAALQSPAWPLRMRLQLNLASIGVLTADGRLVLARTACDELLRLSTAAKLDSATAGPRRTVNDAPRPG